MRNRKIFAALLIAALLVALGVTAVNAQTFYQKFENIWAKSVTTSGDVIVGDDLTVTDDFTIGGDIATTGGQSMATLTTSGAATIGGAATVAGNATISGTSNLVGNATAAGTFAVNGSSLSVAKTLNLTRQGSIAVSDGGTITPTGTFQELTAAGAVGASIASPAAAGQLLILFNSSANTITLTDTTGLAAAGDIVLAQNDSATLISSQAGWWVELARSNN